MKNGFLCPQRNLYFLLRFKQQNNFNYLNNSNEQQQLLKQTIQ